MISKVAFKDLFTATVQEKGFEKEGLRFSEETGFHIYGELRLKLSLSASEDTSSAQQYLGVIQAYAAAASACALEIGADILEVQGERIHLLLPGLLTKENVQLALSFSLALANIVYEKVAPLAGEDWQGFAMALDHGPAILINAGNGANGSIISLGCCANAPAKRLIKEKTPAGHLTIPTRVLDIFHKSEKTNNWQVLDLLKPDALFKPLLLWENRKRFGDLATNILKEELKKTPKVFYANLDYIEKNLGGNIINAIQVQGIYFRADLDGFSKEVEAAFATGEKAVADFVKRFASLMGYESVFLSQLDRRTITLPWAGDCANFILLPKAGESYQNMQRSLIPISAAKWHDQKSGFDIQERAWKELMGKAEWALGIAGGDEDEGASGHLLVAPIQTHGRQFLIAAGWGVRRSLDAQMVDGARGKDTIIPEADFKALDSPYKKLFSSINSVFYRVSGLSMQKVRDIVTSFEIKNPPVVVPSVNVVVPKPRPYHK